MKKGFQSELFRLVISRETVRLHSVLMHAALDMHMISKAHKGKSA